MVPKIHCSSLHKITNFQFLYIFKKILQDRKNLQIFEKWIGGVDNESK